MTSSARCSTRQLAVLVIAAISLTACATATSEPRTATVCPPVVEYSQELQARAADELDLLPGQMKLKQGGGAAGHNGLKDILAQLGAADFWRLRIGIGHPGVRAEVANWVLRKPPLDERIAIDSCIDTSLATLPLLLAGDMNGAMMRIHAKPQRPKPPRPPGLMQEPPP